MSPDSGITIQGQSPICISFSSRVAPNTACVSQAALAEAVNKDHDEIHLFLSTPGGTVQDGVTIYNLINALPVPVITYNIGNVNSIGNVIYQAGSRRISAPVSSFMFHGVGFEFQSARLEMKDFREKMQGLQNDQSLISDIMAKHTPLGRGEVDELFLNMAHFKANEALDRGITDEIRKIRLPRGVPITQLVFK